MLTRRRRLFAVLTIAVLLGTLTLPQIRWTLVGWVWSEPYWREWPASYYAARIRSSMRVDQDGLVRPRVVTPAEQWGSSHLPGWATGALWPGTPFSSKDEWLAVDAVPVLRRLMGNSDLRVRWFAACSLLGLGEDGSPAVPELVALLDDRHPQCRCTAALVLGYIGPEARAAIPKLRGLKDDQAAVGDRTVSGYARDALRRIAPNPPE